MLEHNTFEQRLLDIETRLATLERYLGDTVPKRVQELDRKLGQRVEEKGIDVAARAVGQIEVLAMLKGPGGVWASEEDFALEDLTEKPSESLAASIGALAHPARIELYKALLTGPKESSALLEIAGLNTTGQLYHHLTAMEELGLVERRSRNLWAPQNHSAFMLLIAAGHILSAWRGEE